MDLLDHVIQNKARLFDYECITKDGEDKQPRLVAFGKYAGIAGMIDGLQGFGQKLLAEGYSTPFLNIPKSHMLENLDQARYLIRNIGQQIVNHSLPKQLCPLVFAFTGSSGNVVKGAREIFELFPHEYVKPDELPTLIKDIEKGVKKSDKLYGVLLNSTDIVKRKNSEKHEKIEKSDYYANPYNYESNFHENVLPYISFLVNGMYWDDRFPRLLTKVQINEFFKSKSMVLNGNERFLRFIADISCDIHGSIEFMNKITTIENPYFTFNPINGESKENISKDGISILSVEILPTELPRDASDYFGAALMPLLPPLLNSPGAAHARDIEDLPKELQRACLISHGELLPKWAYISRMRQKLEEKNSKNSSFKSETAGVKLLGTGKVSVDLTLTGHLFDTGLINQVFDFLERENKISFSVLDCDVRPNLSSTAIPSVVKIRIRGENFGLLRPCTDHIKDLIEKNERADGYITIKDNKTSINEEVKSKINENTRRVLLLGAGRVAGPVVQLLGHGKCGNKNEEISIHLTIASDNPLQAKELAATRASPGCVSLVQLDLSLENAWEDLNSLVEESDVILSLLPTTMHAKIADLALKHEKHLVTASYVSAQMTKLHDEAKNKNLIFLNEVGLDPGIDHMLVMQAIDSIQDRGGQVDEMISLCGGLPDPSAANNPLLYKFSWSPRGVISAAQNSAQYLKNNETISIKSDDLLRSVLENSHIPTLRLEVLPNRDSLVYKGLYGIPKASHIFRGTFRYEGWSNIMYAFRTLGLFDQNPTFHKTWSEYLNSILNQNNENKDNSSSKKVSKERLNEYLEKHGVKKGAVPALDWLGVTGDSPISENSNTSVVDSFCALLTEKLEFSAGERDLVVMSHVIKGFLPDGTREEHSSQLIAFGDEKETAMASTVGLTAGAAVELVLLKKISQRGVIIPTSREIYEPLLNRLNSLGIKWNDSIISEKD